ncbi:MAG: acetyl-CoA carboxylase biotin carboxylase subunit [Deltaproteobacteria bacterium]|nr:acetyl-CoA carboxylase biotin carboxylase subunit [Deltaproteobacteria bacterium]
MLKKILIANRGEIAVRVMRACRELDIPCVAVYSEADRDALFVRYADEAYCIGPARASESYLNIEKIIKTALEKGADAIHPGYGFLAENSEFAAATKAAGVRLIGPSSRVMALMGDKVAARNVMAKAGVPVVPGTDCCITDPDQALKTASKIGYPVIIKPSGGGGGIGMTVVPDEKGLTDALKDTQKIAANTFGVDDVYIEKYLPNPRHIEFQILADSHGNAIHLGERECSVQRRHQKLIEESPSPVVTQVQREKMGNLVVGAIRSVGYECAGTVEFLYSEGEFYFLEINARIQVEHPVTEMVTGVDIVKEQIRIASGLPLSVSQEEIQMHGNAIECRINAEDPLNDFEPTPGKLTGYHSPGGTGIRVDSGVYSGFTVPPYYDPMISKLIVWGKDRKEAMDRMRRALYEYVIAGVRTNIPFHKAVMKNSRFIRGEIGTHFIEEETGLIEDIKDLLAQEQTLGDKLSLKSGKKARVAAIAASVVASQFNKHQGTESR